MSLNTTKSKERTRRSSRIRKKPTRFNPNDKEYDIPVVYDRMFDPLHKNCDTLLEYHLNEKRSNENIKEDELVNKLRKEGEDNFIVNDINNNSEDEDYNGSSDDGSDYNNYICQCPPPPFINSILTSDEIEEINNEMKNKYPNLYD
tara:strand:- start:1909 stop:2346 length:438 start_codon:yes stop_codon:yes gene_type:complete